LLFDKIESLLPYAALTVRLLNDETKQLEPISARNIDVQEWAKGLESRTAITGQGFSQEVIQKKTPLVIENVQTDPRCWNRELFRKNGLVSYIGLPLSTEGKILGVLGFYLKEQHSFPKEEVEFLSTLAGQVAIGINNAQLYEKIKKQASELEEANQAKDEFLSVMSHELRTPLNVITGYAEVLSQGVLGEIQREQLHAVKTISFQSRELLRMINEILQVGSIEAGKVKATCREVNISDFLEEVKSGYEILSKKEILLQWNVPSRLPIVRTDGEKLKHVLQNLINNALKFTENGSVTVSVECSSEVIEFQVKDTGIGMPQDMLPSIFQMFRQLDSSSTRSYGGSGVGLYIVKKFVDLLGGKIEVESTLGEGSNFMVTLPLEVSETIRTNPDEDLAVKLAG
jgi:signal transduction histidine kinase